MAVEQRHQQSRPRFRRTGDEAGALVEPQTFHWRQLKSRDVPTQTDDAGSWLLRSNSLFLLKEIAQRFSAGIRDSFRRSAVRHERIILSSLPGLVLVFVD